MQSILSNPQVVVGTCPVFSLSHQNSLMSKSTLYSHLRGAKSDLDSSSNSYWPYLPGTSNSLQKISCPILIHTVTQVVVNVRHSPLLSTKIVTPLYLVSAAD